MSQCSDPQDLKAISQAVHDLSNGNPKQFIQDTQIATKTNLSRQEVRDYLDLLSNQGLVVLKKTRGNYRAYLTYKGRIDLKNPDFAAPHSTISISGNQGMVVNINSSIHSSTQNPYHLDQPKSKPTFVRAPSQTVAKTNTDTKARHSFATGSGIGGRRRILVWGPILCLMCITAIFFKKGAQPNTVQLASNPSAFNGAVSSIPTSSTTATRTTIRTATKVEATGIEGFGPVANVIPGDVISVSVAIQNWGDIVGKEPNVRVNLDPRR